MAWRPPVSRHEAREGVRNNTFREMKRNEKSLRNSARNPRPRSSSRRTARLDVFFSPESVSVIRADGDTRQRRPHRAVESISTPVRRDGVSRQSQEAQRSGLSPRPIRTYGAGHRDRSVDFAIICTGQVIPGHTETAPVGGVSKPPSSVSAGFRNSVRRAPSSSSGLLEEARKGGVRIDLRSELPGSRCSPPTGSMRLLSAAAWRDRDRLASISPAAARCVSAVLDWSFANWSVQRSSMSIGAMWTWDGEI